MGKKKNHGGGMSQVRKWGKKILSGLRLGVGISGYSAMTVQGILDHATSDPQNIPAGILYRNTGVDVNSKGFDQSQAITSGLTVVLTTITIALLSYGIKKL